MKFKYIAFACIALLLSGCKNEMQRLQECQAKGISRDACYIADQNRQAMQRAELQRSNEAYYHDHLHDKDKHKHK